MDTDAHESRGDAGSFVSSGTLPAAPEVLAWVAHCHARFADVTDGTVSEVYPALAVANPEHFGLCVASVGGELFAAGDSDVMFSVMSVSKPFVFALVCDVVGPDVLRQRIGVNATGWPFNSAAAIDMSSAGRTNPMVNSGALATTSHAPGSSLDDKWAFVRAGLESFAGRRLDLDQQVYQSASASNLRNRALAHLMADAGVLACDPMAAVDIYTRQCALSASARDLAVMGATLADGGVNPVTGGRVVSEESCHYTLAVMATAGMYEDSGDWLFRVGLPGKSGIAGGIVTVSPGKGALGTYSPRLDAAGNSVRGALAAELLSRRLGMDLFVSRAKTIG